MKKKLPIILLGVILACVLVFGFLYANGPMSILWTKKVERLCYSF